MGSTAAAGRAAHAATAVLAALWIAALWPSPAQQPCDSVRTPPGTESGRSVACTDGPAVPPAGAIALLYGGALDLNRAAPTLLEVLPRIGPARAGAIAAERCRAPFARVDDVLRVAGIGPRTLAGIRPFVEIGSPVLPAESRLLCDEDSAGVSQGVAGALRSPDPPERSHR